MGRRDLVREVRFFSIFCHFAGLRGLAGYCPSYSCGELVALAKGTDK